MQNKFFMAAIVILVACSMGWTQQRNLPTPQKATSNPGGPAAPKQGSAAGGGQGDVNLDKRIGPVVARNNNLEDLLQFVGAQTGLQIVLDPDANAKVTLNLESPTVREFLETVLPANGLDYAVLDNGVIRIGKQENIAQLKQQPIEHVRKVFNIIYKDAMEIQAALEGMRSPEGQIIVDPDTQQIIVTDTPEAIEAMQQLINQLDVETETRVFTIKYANAQEIADQLIGVINTVEGELFVDYRNNQIIITDTPARLDRAQAIIEQLDVEVSIRVIPLAFALPEDVLPLIEGLLTETGYVDFDPRTSRVIIQDIPSIIDQAVRLINQIDIPPQEVYIEADIVQVNNDKSFTLGTSAAFGSDIGAEGNPSAPNTSGATSFFSFNPFLTTGSGGMTLLDVRQGSYRFQIDAMVEKKQAEVIASPRLLIQDGGIGSFILGSQEPFAVRQQSFNFNTSGDYFTQQFREVGTTLNLEVYASESGYVEMFVDMEDTRSRRVQLSNLGDGLAVDGSFINTQVTVKSGRTVVLGGIINRSRNDSHSGVPVLSSIPLLGNLFKSKNTSNSKQKLLIFITPKIVDIDDPYSFAMLDNIQHIQELQQRGATGFVDTAVDEKLLDWSNEAKYEKQAIEEALEKARQNGNASKGIIKSRSTNGQSSMRQPSAKEQMEEGIIRTYSDENSYR